jgi:hypothetical protein
MTPHVLNGALERVSRAEEHLCDLRRRIGRWLVEQEDAVIFEFESHPPHNNAVDVSNCVGPPYIVGILIGEICYNLRSALDYLIFELAKLDSGVYQDGTQFPIANHKKTFDSWAKSHRRKGLKASHIAAIERLQPYNGCDWTKTLRDISNPDKHRAFAGIRGDYRALVSHRLNEPNKAAFDAIPRPIRCTDHPIHGPVDVKIAPTSTVTLDDGTIAVDALHKVQLKVAETLAAFKPDF